MTTMMRSARQSFRADRHLQRGRQGSSRALEQSPRGAWAICVAVGLLCACDSLFGDSRQCEQSVNTVRQAIGFKDFESARKWRDYTWKVCAESDRGVIATLDKEIVDGETALQTEAEAKKRKAKELAQARINSAQALWLKFDAAPPAERNRAALDATRDSAKRLEAGLEPAYLQKLSQYNEAEYQKRLAALTR